MTSTGQESEEPMEPIAGVARELAEFERTDLRRHLTVFQPRDTRGLQVNPSLVDDKSDGGVVEFASNDYLGLARHPAVKAAVVDGLDRFPAGAAASRLICGSSPAHQQLESKLAEFKQTESALLFSCGYAVASGALPALLGKDDFVVLDKLSHACLIDGARMSGATMRVYPHQRLDRLDELLDWCRKRAKPDARILIVTESVFSMDGDQTDLPALLAIKQRHRALLWLDEAHAIGVIGPHGRGLAAVGDLQQGVDFHMGTLSKSMGLAGGYLAARRPWIDLLVNKARSFIFSTAPPPALAWAAITALDLLQGGEGDRLRDRLQERVGLLQRELSAAGIGDTSAPIRTFPEWPQDRGGGVSAIVPLGIGRASEALRLARSLREAGFLVPAIRYPTVPRNSARLRVSLSAVHEPGQVKGLVAHLGRTLKGGGKTPDQLQG